MKCRICKTAIKQSNKILKKNSRNGAVYTRRICLICENKRRRENKKQNSKMYKNHVLKCKFGITLDQYRDILKNQNKKCAICRNKTPARKDAKYFMVDHCHKTNKVRGLLCNNCNLLLGRAKDSVDILKNAIVYLKSGGTV